MSIDPNTLPDGTVVETNGGYLDFKDGDGATCDLCLSELVSAAERDAEARTVMASLRGMFDPMTGRPAGGGW